ncbi:unnamed protein product [Notodromas monacha]|uniref:Dihydrolipoamide acetyltransferase component of pyruvate dehydrogenase complex n=1 Tax=Notodromas monacha TaxID=399045 RepID=A0A7R9GJ54_9CRUS|nr:unnamed protein product [Notodromas monacha]CAG0924628.1 unnamed protein product [Notodromas monacha]
MFRFLTRITCHDRILRHGLHASRVCAVKGEAVKMPSLSPTMSEGTIVNWYKKEGDEIKAGDVLCDIQTDKAVVGFEVEEEGILAKILKPDNSLNVALGSLIALMVEPGVDWKSVEMPEGTTTTTDKPEAVSAPTQVDTHQSSPRSIGPAVRNLLTAHGILPDDVTGTGPYGRLTKGDVLDFIKLKNLKAVEIKPEPVQKVAKVVEAPKQSVETAHYVDVAVSSMRATIAKRLSESKRSIPHAYATVDADLTALLAERQKLKAHGLNISVNNFVIKAVGLSEQAMGLQLHNQFLLVHSLGTR